MKKYLILVLMFVCIFIVGCGKDKNMNVLDDLTKKINGLKGYQLTGKL